MAKVIKMKRWLEKKAARVEKEVLQGELDVYKDILLTLQAMSPVLVRRLVRFCQEEILGEEGK